MKALWSLNRVCFAGLALLSGSRICAADEAECFVELVPNRDSSEMRPMLTSMKLDGIAKGGELVLLEMLNPNPRYIRIDTHAGETAETVIARMAAAINEVSPFNPNRSRARLLNEKGELVSGDEVPIVRAEGNLLKSLGGSPGAYIFAGTETGLGIPSPPTSLSASYDAGSQEVSLHWENPPGPYDAIKSSVGIQAGTATGGVLKYPPPRKRHILPKVFSSDVVRGNKGLRRFTVIGCRGGVLSNAAVITLDYDDNSQQELDTLPFTGGICPNWKAWSHGGEPGMLVLKQGTKGEWKQFDQTPKAPIEPRDRNFFQRIKTSSPAVVGGVYRKFLGLQPGRTYRVYTRMNTFEMDRVHENWSFSFHAVPHKKTVTLSSEQMAGTAPFPDGSVGSLARQVASYGPGSTTKGRFVECSTDKSDPNCQVQDITLPPGAEVITVWFQYSGPPSSGVGFDWIKLKEITE